MRGGQCPQEVKRSTRHRGKRGTKLSQAMEASETGTGTGSWSPDLEV